MSILKMPTKLQATNTTTTSFDNSESKPKTKFWVNVGVKVEDEFISLPMGIPMDNMKPVKVPVAKDTPESKKYVAIQQIKNELLSQIMEQAEKLAPGETLSLPLIVELRHASDEPETMPVSEDISNTVKSLLGF